MSVRLALPIIIANSSPFRRVSMKVYRVHGHLTHNDACLTAPFTSIPRQHLHPTVYHLALDELISGVSLMKVKLHVQAHA